MSAVAGGYAATVSWQIPLDDGAGAHLRYRVVATPGGASCEVTDGLSCSVRGLTATQSYNFSVVATNEFGSSSAVSSASVTVLRSPGLTLDLSRSDVTIPATVTLTAHAQAMTGSVRFRDGAQTLCVRALVIGAATCIAPVRNVGPHDLTVSYDANATMASETASRRLNVRYATTMTFSQSSVRADATQAVTVTAAVSANGAPAPGTVQFSLENPYRVLGSRPLTAGSASWTFAPGDLPSGATTIDATFLGSDTIQGAVRSVTHTVVSTVPRVDSASTQLGPQAGGPRVVLTGIRFTGATDVVFGTRSAQSFTVLSDSSIAAIAPAGIGRADIAVRLGSATSNRVTFSYQRPLAPQTIGWGSGNAVSGTSDGKHVWLANALTASVTEISSSTGKLIRVIGGSQYGFALPVAIDHDDRYVWVANNLNHSVTAFSIKTGDLVRVIDTDANHGAPTAVRVVQGHVWVSTSQHANGTPHGWVSEYSAVSGARLRSIEFFGEPIAMNVDLSSNSPVLRVLNSDDGGITTINEATGASATHGATLVGNDPFDPWFQGSFFTSIGGADTAYSGNSASFATTTPYGSFVAPIGCNCIVTAPNGVMRTNQFPGQPISATSDGSHLWVTLKDSDLIYKANLDGSNVSIASSLHHFSAPHALFNDGTSIWVANDNGRGNGADLTQLSARTGALIRTIKGPWKGAFGSVWSDGTGVWASGFGGMVEYSASTGQQLAILNDGDHIVSGALASAGSSLWAANDAGTAVTQFSKADGHVLRVVNSSDFSADGDRFASITSDGRRLWVLTYEGKVLELSAVDGALLRTGSPLGGGWVSMSSAQITFQAGRLFVAVDTTLLEISLNDLSHQVMFETGHGFSLRRPFGVATDGVHIWLADAEGSRVYELDAVSGSLVRSIRGADSGIVTPISISTDGINVWIGNLRGGSLAVFPAT